MSESIEGMSVEQMKSAVRKWSHDAHYAYIFGVGVIVARGCIIGNSGMAATYDGVEDAAWARAYEFINEFPASKFEPPSPVEEAKCECGHALENHADENGGYSWACDSCPQKAPCMKFRKASRLQPSPTEETRSGADRRAGIISDEIAGRLQSSSVESNHFEEAVDEVIRLSRQNNPEVGVSPQGEKNLLHEANEWLAGFDEQVWEPNLAKGIQLVSMLMAALTPQEGAKPRENEELYCSFTDSGEHVLSTMGDCIYCLAKDRPHKVRTPEAVEEGKSSDSREDGFEEWWSAQEGEIVVEMGDDKGLQNALLALAKTAWQAALRSHPSKPKGESHE